MEESTGGIGRIRRMSLRQVWPREDYDFTPWLQENLDVLNDALGIELASADREEAAGDFSVDLLAEDTEGRFVIIENQLGQSDHNHLGKVLTYLTAFDASGAIWITAEARPEHVSAVSWLNENSAGADFYLLKVEAIRIGESSPAPLLTQIVGPSEERRQVGEVKKKRAERFNLREDFWSQLLERARDRTQLHASISPGQYSWIGTSAGVRGLGFNYVVWKDQAAAELYIDRGKGADDENEKVYEYLLSRKEEIEEVFGGALEWERLPEKRACRIRKTIEEGGYRSEQDRWPTIQRHMVDAMIQLEKALRPQLSQLPL